jgi:hypothetical protein
MFLRVGDMKNGLSILLSIVVNFFSLMKGSGVLGIIIN